MSGVCLLASVLPGTARAEPVPPDSLASNLDGLYLMIGVEGGPIRIDSMWDSSVGGHLGLVSYTERRRIRLVGLELGMTQYGERSGGRAWIAPAIGVSLGALVGISGGLAAEWEPLAREDGRSTLPTPRLGAMATAWVFAGVVPYVGVGRFAQTGSYLEIGLRLSLPAIRFTRTALP